MQPAEDHTERAERALMLGKPVEHSREGEAGQLRTRTASGTWHLRLI